MDGIDAPHQWSGLFSACSQAGQDGGYQLTSLMTVHGLMVQVVEHGGVLGYLVRAGDLDCRSGGFERDGIVVLVGLVGATLAIVIAGAATWAILLAIVHYVMAHWAAQ